MLWRTRVALGALAGIWAIHAAWAQPAEPRAELPHWLTGQWVSQQGEELWEEHWSAPAGGAMMGMTRWVRGDSAKLYEFQTIERTEDGGIVLLLRHFGAPGMELWASETDAPMRFTLIDARYVEDRAGGVEHASVIFERAAEDAAQRVTYQLVESGVCEVRVSLRPEGATEWTDEVTFEFRRPVD